ncbi:MAG: hypothetical protein ABIT37_22120 [Luteolibacter sp.]
MNQPLRLPMKLVSHGLALLIGCSIGMAWIGDFKPVEHALDTPSGVPASSAANTVMATAWLDDSLKSVREKAATEEQELKKPLTMAELLRQSRIKADAERKEYSDEVDQIIAAAPGYAHEPDPAQAIRRNMADPWEESHVLQIFQAWLDKDQDAALAELGRNWKLQERDDLVRLLERKFGREWLKREILDEEVGYRLRKNLASQWGRNLAWDEGLESFVKNHNSIPDAELRSWFAISFSGSWPLEDPETTGRILEQKAPPELRKSLLASWAPIPELGSSGFIGCGGGMPPSYATREWFDRVRRSMPSEHADVEQQVEPVVETRKIALSDQSLDQRIGKRIKAGDNREEAVKHSLPEMIFAKMGEGTDLETLFGEKRISREEMLSELTRRIPGSEAFPKELERAAWGEVSSSADPEEVASWGAKLSDREKGSALLDSALARLNDPRMSRRLNLYRAIASGMPDGDMPASVCTNAAIAFGSWVEISPAAAKAWRDSLPETDRLRQTLEKGKDAP